MTTNSSDALAVDIKNLHFRYSARQPVVLEIESLEIPAGSRVLLVGDNGSGKSTLLRVLAGQKLHEEGAVKVFGKSAFHDTTLNNVRSFISNEWGRVQQGFSGQSLLTADMKISEMMRSLQSEYPERRAKLMDVLKIDPNWSASALSSGQRRRVHLFLTSLRPSALILSDESTIELDVVTRRDWMDYLKECGSTIIFSSHIFDGLDDWPTHILQLDQGRIIRFGKLDEIEDLVEMKRQNVSSPLLRVIEKWLRESRAHRVETTGEGYKESPGEHPESLRGELGNGFLPGRFNNGFT